MKLLVFLVFSSLTYSMANTSEKLVLFADKTKVVAEDSLYILENLFLEDASYKAVKDKYPMQDKVEKLGDFYLLTLAPITSIKQKNDLVLLMNKRYNELFFINESNQTNTYLKEKSISKKPKITKKQPISFIEHKIITKSSNKKLDYMYWIKGLELQWFTLWSLSVLGLILSIRSRRKLLKLTQTQEDFNSWQKKIEYEIQNLKGNNA